MAFNVPEFQIIKDNDKDATIKVVGYFNQATTSNTAFSANTLFGANTSLNCISSIINILYSTGLANGRVSLEFVSTVNANIRASCFGHFNDGEFQKYIPNNANTPTGDYNINIENAGANDTFTLIFSVAKEAQGLPGNAQHYGANAWANCFNWQ